MARPKMNQTDKQPAAPPAPKKKLTLNEFRAWLSGVEEMQADDWTPNASQWKTIRSKIEEVIDVPVQQQRQRFVEDGYEERPPAPVRPSGPSAFAGSPTMAPSGPAPIPGADGKIKTPNIDTSKTAYVSSLE